MARIQAQVETSQWVATREEANTLAGEKSKTNWGIFVTKVNKANRRYTHGYVVSWREPKQGKSK